ncbi:helix-turn-helix domain-containing protein [Streptacidiphilus anmyonensis]|uniref:helix-turn-helix domain-containing protein n=1 Tax=Streptacidiphilus anmyonensis TaxID=405782 RepID=UPI0034E27341
MDSYWDDPGEFRTWLRQAAKAAGYDLTPGAGGRAALSRDTGISEAQIGAALNNPRARPSLESLRLLAKALGKAPLELFVAAGYIRPEEVTSDDRRRPLTAVEHLSAAAFGLDLPVPTHPLFVRLSRSLAAGLTADWTERRAEEPRSAGRGSERDDGRSVGTAPMV